MEMHLDLFKIKDIWFLTQHCCSTFSFFVKEIIFLWSVSIEAHRVLLWYKRSMASTLTNRH